MKGPRILALLLASAALAACARRPAAPALRAVERDGRFGYADGRGRVIIAPRYLAAGDFGPGGLAAVLDDSGWSYIDRRGRTLIRPFLVDNGPDPFAGGLARFVEHGRFGFFDEAGRVVIAPAFDFARPFSEGLAAVCRGCRLRPDGEYHFPAGGRWGFIDRRGRLVIPLRFEEAGDFRSGSAPVLLDGLRRRVTATGTLLPPN